MLTLHALNLRLVAPLVAPLLIGLWTMRGPLRQAPWPALVAIAYFGRIVGSTALANIRTPYEWDYACFWLYGHIAVAHQNIYDPAVFAHFSSPFSPSAEFVQAVINVGFPYPPPTIVLFWPLGFIDSVPIGLTIWYVVQFAAFAAATWFLARRFMPAHLWSGATLIAAVILALPATQANVYNAQTNFLVLLVVALALDARETFWGGFWQMLVIWLKPFTAALFLLDIVRGNRRTLLGAALTAAFSLLGSALLVGPQAVASYFRSGPAGREPAFAFVESVNQSLLAVLLRFKPVVPEHVSVLHEPEYLIASLVLIAATVECCRRAPRNSDVAFASCLLLGMLIYPATLLSYGVVLAVPLFVLWAHRGELPGNAIFVVCIFAIVAVLQGQIVPGSNFEFAATLTLWIVTLVLLTLQSCTAGTSRRALDIVSIGS